MGKTDKIGIREQVVEVDYGAESRRLQNALRQSVEEFRVRLGLEKSPEVAAVDAARGADGGVKYKLISERAGHIKVDYGKGRTFTADFTGEQPDILDTVTGEQEIIETRPGADAVGCELLAGVLRDISRVAMDAIIRGAAVGSRVNLGDELNL